MRPRDLAVSLLAAALTTACFPGRGGFGFNFGFGFPVTPSAPAGLTTTPSRNAVDDFTFRWQPSANASTYSFSVDGRTLGSTSDTSVRLVDRSSRVGSHQFCVSARSASRVRSLQSCVAYEWQRIRTTITEVSWPSGLLGSTVTVSARLLASGTSGPRALADRALRFDYQYGGATATTDGSGVARTILVLGGRAGTYTGVVTFAADREHEGAQARTTFRIYVDTTPPSVPAPAVTPSRSQVNDFTASWSASSDDITGVDRYAYRIDGGSPSYTTMTSVRGPLAASLGTHRFEVSAIDKAGNQSAYGTTTFELFVAPTPPPPPPPAATPRQQTQGSPPAPRRISVDIPPR